MVEVHIEEFDRPHYKVFRMVSPAWKENSYIVIGRATGRAVVIDPGAVVDEVRRALEKQGAATLAILVTHAHYDHIEGAAHLRDITGARVYIHREDVALLRSVNAYALAWRLPTIKVPPADVILEQDQVVSVDGLSVQVLHVPGHTKGSVAYAIDDMLFVGDTILPTTVGRVDLPGGDKSALQSSIKKLLSFAGEHCTLFPGHGAPAPLTSIVATNSHLRELSEAPEHEDRSQSETRTGELRLKQ
jgi:hydroxyacylglutathione hydrolase